MPQVYERFFQLRPDAEGLMQQADVSMRGRMLDQTFELLMDPDVLGPESYFRWEVTNHVSAYGVSADMYGPYFQAMGEVLAPAMGTSGLSKSLGPGEFEWQICCRTWSVHQPKHDGELSWTLELVFRTSGCFDEHYVDAERGGVFTSVNRLTSGLDRKGDWDNEQSSRTFGALVLVVIAYTALSPQSADDQGATADVAAIGSAVEPTMGFIDDERIKNAESEPGNWLSFGRTYEEQRHLAANANQQRHRRPVGSCLVQGHEHQPRTGSDPIVVDDTMFFPAPGARSLPLMR